MPHYDHSRNHIMRQRAQNDNPGMNDEELARERERTSNSQVRLQRKLDRSVQRMHEIQAKREMEISQPGDTQEKEADEIAEKVSNGQSKEIASATPPPANNIHRKQDELMAKSEDGALRGTDQLQAKLDSSKGSGQAMDDSTKSEMEGKMNADLSDVRIHTGTQAHEMAEGINAKAFTHGQDVYFKDGNYNPNSKEGKNLLAHELVHTQQQANTLRRVVQQPNDYGMKGGYQANYNTSVNNALRGYFEEKYDGGLNLRDGADDDEYNAVLSVLLERVPNPMTTINQVVPVSYTPKGGRSILSIYLMKYETAPEGGKAKASAYFMQEKTGGSGTATAQIGSTILLNSKAPANKEEGIETAMNPVESNKLQNFYAEKVSKKEAYKGFVNAGTVQLPVYYYIDISFDGNKILSGSGWFVYVGKEPAISLPQQNKAHKEIGYGEFMVKKDQDKNYEGLSYKLGTITGMDKVPVNEKLMVNDEIRYYYENGTRDTELDVSIPIADDQRVSYTLKFYSPVAGKMNADVVRLGTKTELEKNGPAVYDITKTRDYSANSSTSSNLISWLQKRYPKLAPAEIAGKKATPTITDIQQAMKTTLKDKAGTVTWFDEQYKVAILSDSEASNILAGNPNDRTPDLNDPKKSAYNDIPENERANITKFSPEELLQLENTFQSMSNETLKLIAGTMYYRQKEKTPGDRETAGFARSRYGYDLVAIYDRAAETQTPGEKNLDNIHGGTYKGKTQVYEPAQFTMVHETAHAIADKEDKITGGGKKYIEAFHEFVDKNSIKAFTWYSKENEDEAKARTNTRGEFWAEAFALFHLDPQWMEGSHKNLFDWFDQRF